MKPNVTIIGAGVGGLALGIALKKLDIHAEIFETWPPERVEESSFGMNSSGVYALKELGVLKKIQNASYSADYLKAFTFDPIEVGRLNLFQSEKYEERAIFIKRADLIEILTEEAMNLNVPIHYNKQFLGYEEMNLYVTAIFKDGTTHKSDLLIGADGVHSPVRKQMYPNHRLKFEHSFGLYGVISSKDIPESILSQMENTELVYFGQGTNIFLTYSNRQSELDVNWQSTGYVERKLPVNAFELRDQEDLKQDFIQNYNIQGDLAEFVTKSHGIIPKQVFTVDGLISWSKNRVAVIGDAAHGINPNTGYGSSIALEDAVYLASLLNKHGHEDAFYYYEADRKDRVDAIMATLESFNVSYGLEMFDFRNGFDIGMLGESQFDPNYQVKLNE